MNTVASTAQAAVPSRSKVLHIALWVVQILLAASFAFGGWMKATAPFDTLAPMGWPGVVGQPLTRFIGVSEVLGAIGLVLPAVTRIRPMLTPLAAAGLVVVMILAAGYHVLHGEFSVLPINFILGAAAAFVAWGRFRKAPIAPRA